jgi:methionyl-tRNA synthetase
MTRTYVTVAIPYVNADPHLGYAYELILADVFARARRRDGSDVRFLGGTDDYSLKNVLAAQAAGTDVRVFVDAHAAQFEALAGPLGLSFDDFIRTSTDRRHRPAVERLWRTCAANGDLYRRFYEGDYCVGCEQFYTEDLLIDGCCPEHGTPVERVAEENWFFRLSRYQDYLEQLIATDQLVVRPDPFREEVLAFIRSGLDDISVSRSASRAHGWGIGVPDDPTQVIYVWFDALTNYVSALEYGDRNSRDYRTWWTDADHRVHVIGKGILRFHAVYWPAFLASAGEASPTRIQVHPYLTVGGQKLSKSSGNSIDPARLVADFGLDALRWWCARDVTPVADTDFTAARLVARANEDLANGLGNVTNRIVTLVHRYRGGVVPSADTDPIDAVRVLEQAVLAGITQFDLRTAARLITDAVTALNRELETTKPWQLAKHEDTGGNTRDRLDTLLARYIRSARVIAAAVEPIIPGMSLRLQDQLGRSQRLPNPEPVFVRIDRA